MTRGLKRARQVELIIKLTTDRTVSFPGANRGFPPNNGTYQTVRASAV